MSDVRPARPPLAPAPGRVRVYWARTERAVPGLEALLAPDELRRADGFHRPADRRRQVVGAALLRVVAAAFLGRHPASVPIRRRCDRCGGPHGRPRVAGSPWLQLSLAHAGNWAVVAAAADTAVGVDVERLPAGVPPAEVLAVATGPGEDAWRAEPVDGDGADLEERALTVWTRKEAVLKAVGVGLAARPASLRLSGPGAPPRLLSWPHDMGMPAGVTLHDLSAPLGHAAALAVLGPVRSVVESDAETMLRDAGSRPEEQVPEPARAGARVPW
ncbi:4'-phosphopantetheinyl transferase superfamily protein [Geodermatophilus sp. DF01-2]|uniref:4'-phosphopantetheinyl transferase family protein n=1 Tax=Geodermatophilus sp. DF01-2 TaxID=2559610 RepID=UPI0010740795|nr:4'-phosphopantetheinyl transferase superfamily protein [Geodermatophilus sp. DF01_2]TFV63994.1 4'-phosphopantetheinyl transferase superfamily protein [Geodermatophilus sp. DF01_2]